MTHRVRILRTGKTTSVVHIDVYETACAWAYETLHLNRALDADGIWCAVLESGALLWDPMCVSPDLFIPDGDLKEGLVLDKKLLHNPKVDVQMLFGLS